MARIVVVGAGIGGLCAARAIALAGHEALVVERAPRGTAIGAGLLLWPNAVHALDALGLGAAVRAIAGPARRATIRGATGRVVSELDMEALGREAGAPMLVVERPALHDVLAEGVDIHYDAPVAAAGDGGVTLEGGARVGGDAVIGADGIGSVVREHVCPGARPRDAGHTVVRGIADHDIGAGETFEAWGRGELVGGAALPAGRSYWFYEAAEVDAGDPLGAIDPAAWPAPFAEQLAATPRDALLVNRILRLDALPAWTRGRVALLGDAAHAMEPNLGQGAAQAVEDAGALLGALGEGGDLAAALARYAAARRPRATLLQRESSRFARIALSRHAGPRDLVAGAIPEAVRRRALRRLLQARTRRARSAS